MSVSAAASVAFVTEGTATVTITEPAVPAPAPVPEVITVRLRRRIAKPKKGLAWGSNIPDNEFMGRKSSKKCCVFHAPKKWNESDTESDDERPRREFNRHVHPPGWDASECAQCAAEKEHMASCPHHDHDHDHHDGSSSGEDEPAAGPADAGSSATPAGKGVTFGAGVPTGSKNST